MSNNKIYFPHYREEDKALADIMTAFNIADEKLHYLPSKGDEVKIVNVHIPEGEYQFLHEAAIIEYHEVLFASWYSNFKTELNGRTPICERRSYDGGKTWSDIKIIADDGSERIIYCPPVYGICDDKLYMLINEMVKADHIHALDLFVLDEESDRFVKLWSRPIPFKLNTNVVTLNNGKLMLPGRIAEIDGFPNTPAVLISDSGKIDAEWRLVKIAENGKLPDGEEYVHPECSSVVLENIVYMFCRNDNRHVPIMYISEDNGETWSEPMAINIPFIHSKIYSGTLSDGRNYVVGNVLNIDRTKLAIYFSEKGSMHFNDAILLTDGAISEFPDAKAWHYPCAVESNGELKIICSLSYENDSRGAALITVPIN